MPAACRRTIAPSLAILLLLAAAVATTRAQITWSSTFFSTNRDSSGSDLSSEFIFYLGVFNPPPPGPGESAWTPTPANTAEWAGHWITADAVVYNTTPPPGGSVPINNFSSIYLPVALVEGISLTDRQGYIWGVNRRHPDAEWFLVTHPTWSWPEPGIFGFPANWQVSNATPVLGQVDQGGVHMQFAAVTNSLPPLVRPAIWLQTYFSRDEIENEQDTLTGWTADPDKDQIPNILEFAHGTDPTRSGHETPLSAGAIEIADQVYQTLTVHIDPNADLTMSAEVSSDLVQWFADPASVVISTPTPSLMVFRDLTPRSPARPFRAIRFRSTLP